MEVRSLLQFARFKPLAAWSLSGSAVGVALAFFLGGGSVLNVVPMALAICCVVLMQYVAHPMNDIMDYDLDRNALIGETGRHKPLVDGSATLSEVKRLSIAVVALVLIILAYLVLIQPVLALPAAYGLVALFGYNHPQLRWAYRPFTELYLSMPINALAVFVIAFIGSGAVTGTSVVMSVVFGFASSTFFVSMMSMDYPSDVRHRKWTTVAIAPALRYCTLYPLLGLVLAAVSLPVLISELGAVPALAYLSVTGVVLSLLAWYGSKVDGLRHRYLRGEVTDMEGRSGDVRLRQLYLSVGYAAVLVAFFVWMGV
mgnify:CR=1 FL=1